MSLRNRLDALRRESGVGDEPGAAPVATDLRNRLARLGGRGSRHARRAARRPEAPAALAARLGGELTEEGLVVVTRRYSAARRHGDWPLAGSVPPALRGPGGAPARVTCLDIETTGLSGGTGTAVFNVGVAVARGDEVELRQWLLTGFSGEAAMLRDVAAWLGDAGLLISYNGKCFDVPLLRDRTRLQRLADLPEPPHLDLLYPVRRLFGGIWPSCRLAEAERRLLGLERRQDLPGAEAPRAWRAYLAGEPGHGLERVLAHNALDVLSLVALPRALGRVLDAPLVHGAKPLAAARMWRQAGRYREYHRVLGQVQAQQWLDLADTR